MPPGDELYTTFSSSSGCNLGFNVMLAQKADIKNMPWKAILVVVIKFLNA